MHTRRLSPSLLVLVPILMALSLLSCGRDAVSPVTSALESPSGVAQGLVPARYLDETSNPPPRSTPEQLLTAYFEDVYESRDSVLYRAMLDRQFRFEFLAADADSLGMDSWTKRLDLRSTGSMFRDGRVETIVLNVLVNANLPYFGEDCDDCRQMETTITLRVIMNDGSGEPFILAVDSPQTFIVRPDIEPEKWSVFRQIDRPAEAARVEDGGPASRVESFSWGRVKGFFFQ
jgi:hypothetical protein